MAVDLDRLEAIFTEALTKTASAERAAFLDQACGADSELRGRVEALLSAHLSTTGLRDLPHFHSGPLEETPGATIGRYTLIEQIGEGGFGIVFRAQQESPVRRIVALKIIKLGMDTRQVVARFEAERQALAIMDHPGIAKVFDAGATDSGRPYFVMEFVPGVPLIQYCDQNNLGIRPRLELFALLCLAVQHAHQKGLIHRDIKPSNVLVITQDARSMAKIIDFGIAKATQARLTEDTLFTESAQLIGTPEYMSPEQAAGNVDIDTRSDIYSLGVLLYELLTGSPPFESRDLRSKALAEMQRIIREVDPPTPSTRLSSSTSVASVAARRGIEPKKLAATIHGELDWIVMKCLEKNRARRYDSASALANDVTSFLADEPIAAGAPSRIYRLRKAMRRNRVPVIASAAVLVALLAGVIVTSVALVGQRRLRIAERQQAEEATRQTAIARAVSEFQSDMLASADPDKLMGDKVTVLQAINAAVKELDAGKLKDQPLVEAKVRDTIGNTLNSLGRYDQAEPILRKALELRRAALPAGDREIAQSLINLGTLLQSLNKLDEAESLDRESIDIYRKLGRARLEELSTAQNNLAWLLHSKGRLAESEQLIRESLAGYRKAMPPGHPYIALGLNNLSGCLIEQGKIAEAEPFARESLVELRKSLPAGSPNIATGAATLAVLLKRQGKHAEAEPLFRETLETYRHAFPAEHPNIALAASNLGLNLRDQGKFAEAEPLLREALEIRRKALPAGNSTIDSSVHLLALDLMDEEKLKEAEPLVREVIADYERTLGKEHWQAGVVRMSLGRLLFRQQRFPEAKTELIEAERLLTAPAAPAAVHETAVREIALMYESWDRFEPNAGHADAAKSWRNKLPTTSPTQP